MLIKCNFTQKDELLNYIGKNYYKSLYLYLNMQKYGFNNKNIQIYKQIISDKIVSILLIYGKTIHILSNNKSDLKISEICNLFYEKKCTMICGEQEIINKFYKNVEKDKFEIELGNVRGLTSIEYENNFNDILKISGDDLIKAADLILKSDDISNTYQRADLIEQLKTRNSEKYSRNYIIKIDNKIVAHVGTGAENNEIAVINYLVVDTDFRRMGLATKIMKKICIDLKKERKKIYLINYTKQSDNLYDKLGFKIMCKYGKCYLRKEFVVD